MSRSKRRLSPSQRPERLPDAVKLWNESPGGRRFFLEMLPPSCSMVMGMLGLNEHHQQMQMVWLYARSLGHRVFRFRGDVVYFDHDVDTWIDDLYSQFLAELHGSQPEVPDLTVAGFRQLMDRIAVEALARETRDDGVVSHKTVTTAIQRLLDAGEAPA